MNLNELEVLYDYSKFEINRLQQRFIALDNKASQTISIASIVTGLTLLTINTYKTFEMKILLFIGIICLIVSILCCVLALRLRYINEAPLINEVLNWINKKRRDRKELYEALIKDIATVQKSYNFKIDRKVIYVSTGQIVEIIGIIIISIFIIYVTVNYK